MTTKETQHENILLDLLQGRKLTQLDSYFHHGTVNLPCRCGELRRWYGWPIQSERIEIKSRFGVKRVNRYFL